MKALLLLLSFFASGIASANGAKAPARIDARTDETAELSYGRMIRESTPEMQQALRVAVLRIGLEGASTVQQVEGDQALRTLSVVTIKDKVAGMSAAEIVARANRGVIKARYRP